jgi:hypothetical protein
MAPEQFDPTLAPIGPATDVWALGVILYELATGKRPFPGTEPPVLARQVRQPPDYSMFRGRQGRRLAAVVARCLQVPPERRYGSAGEFADDLARLARNRRRWLVGGAACVLLCAVFAGLTAGIDWSERAYQRHVAAHRVRLGQGEAVRLVEWGADRPPYRVREGAEATRVWQTLEGLRIESNADCSLIEFLDLPLDGAYTIRARLLMERVLNTKAAFGVYVGHRGLTIDGRRHHAYTFAGFAEHTVPDRITHLILSQHYYSPAPPRCDLRSIDHTMCESDTQARKLVFEGGDRGDLVVTVRRAVVEVGLVPPNGGKPVSLARLGPLDRIAFANTVRDVFNAPVNCDPADPVRIGILVAQSSCIISRFEVEPVAQE